MCGNFKLLKAPPGILIFCSFLEPYALNKKNINVPSIRPSRSNYLSFMRLDQMKFEKIILPKKLNTKKKINTSVKSILPLLCSGLKFSRNEVHIITKKNII